MQPSAANPPVSNYPLGQAPAGTYLAKTDGIYQALVQYGITPLITFLNAPPWATDYGNCGLLDKSCQDAASAGMLFPNDAHIQNWSAFVSAMAARYPAAVIEPWNEPNLATFWKPTAPDAVQMTQLQCAAYRAVKQLPTPNTVTSPGLGVFTRARTDGSPLFRTYAIQMYSNGLRGCMDVLSVHLYGGVSQMNLGAGSLLAEQFYAVRDVRSQFSDSQPFWITETGTTSFTVGEDGQRDRNTRIYNRLMTMPDVGMVLFYSLRDANTQPEDDNPNSSTYSFGFFREDMTPKPVACEFAGKAASILSGC